MGILLTLSMLWPSAHFKLVSQTQIPFFSVVDSLKIFVMHFKFGAMSMWIRYNLLIIIFVKVFNVRRTSHTCIVLDECCRLPMGTSYYNYINCIRYWCNLLNMPSHRHPKQCYNP